MFEKLVKRIIEANNAEEMNEVCGEISNAFCNCKISYADHETLYNLVAKIRF